MKIPNTIILSQLLNRNQEKHTPEQDSIREFIYKRQNIFSDNINQEQQKALHCSINPS